jgi:hypothetical protein
VDVLIGGGWKSLAAILAQYEGVKPPKAISTNRMAIHR